VHRVEAGRDLPLLGFDERNEDGPVTQSRGKGADTCKGGRGESVEDADRFAIAFAPVSTGTPLSLSLSLYINPGRK